MLFLLSILTSVLYGQKHHATGMYIEAGSGINLSYFDIGGGSPGISFQGSALFALHPSWRLGANVGLHHTNGSDEGTPNAARGYEYRSNLMEISVKGVYVVRFKRYPPKKWKRKLEPRVFATLGLLQVQSIHNRQLFASSDDPGLPIVPVFSGGVGLAYILNDDLSLILEAGSNLSTSDFLEGYTNVLNSTSSDMFHTLLLKFIFKVPG